MIKADLSKHIPFWILIHAALIGLTLPVLVQDGMFMDGMLYTSVSHNLSLGIGTFWFPQFSAHNVAGLSSFHEQPPLIFGIQALFFKALGSSMYVERLYIFLTLVITSWLITLLWKRNFKDLDPQRRMGWLPLLLWITIPVCFWSYSNNMHENTMGIFCLLAVLWLQKNAGTLGYYRHSLLAGVFIFLATFSKGVPGLFPLAVPLLQFFILKRGSLRSAAFSTIILIAVLLFIYGILWLFPSSRESLETYFFKRALLRMNELPTVESRFYIAGRLFMELLPQLVLVTIVVLVSRLKRWRISFFSNPEAWFFIAVGLAASAPLLLTKVQKGFYLVPSFPYFAIASALFISPVLMQRITMPMPGTRSYKIWLAAGVSALIFTIGITFAQIGKTSRNSGLLSDVYKIGKVVPSRSVLSIPGPLWNRWDLQCYLMRYFQISLEKSDVRTYYLHDRTLPEVPPVNYSRVDLPTEIYDLYKSGH